MSRPVPYQISRLDRGDKVSTVGKGCTVTPFSHFPRFVYDTMSHAPDPLDFLVDHVEGTGLDTDELEKVGLRTAAEPISVEPFAAG